MSTLVGMMDEELRALSSLPGDRRDERVQGEHSFVRSGAGEG
ncbi:hypothetical protein [Amycolatopsis sp. H20-H5]|nr:hypothetical protein [Amycolatopsis sp. H20-H5]MEC3976971.1 hypothetical protein [Amycolatopsis sp. H20-H5]